MLIAHTSCPAQPGRVRRLLPPAAVVLLTVAVGGCQTLALGTAAPPVEPTVVTEPGVTQTALSAGDQALERAIATMPVGQQQALGDGAILLMEAEYTAASGRQCRRALVTGADARLQSRVACLDAGGWQLRRPIQGDGPTTFAR